MSAENKPHGCHGCPFANKGRKILYDDNVFGSEVTIIFDKPEGENIAKADVWASMGRRLLRSQYVPLLGDVVVDVMHMRRCTGTGTASETREATEHCRAYDRIPKSTRVVIAAGDDAWAYVGGQKPRVDWSGFAKPEGVTHVG